MIIVVEGSKTFSNYESFMRGMGVALSYPMKSDKIYVWSLGPTNINRFTAAFCNSSENYLRQRGLRVRHSKVTYDHAKNNMKNISYYAFFCNRNDKNSQTVALAEISGVEVGVFKY